MPQTPEIDSLGELLRKQLKSQEYGWTDSYLKTLEGADIETLGVHLRVQLETYKFAPIGPVLKSINIIKSLIEAKGGDLEDISESNPE